MPQLKPSPWLAILLLTWLVFVVIIPYKVMALLYPNDPKYKDMWTSPSSPWHWPWH